MSECKTKITDLCMCIKQISQVQLCDAIVKNYVGHVIKHENGKILP